MKRRWVIGFVAACAAPLPSVPPSTPAPAPTSTPTPTAAPEPAPVPAASDAFFHSGTMGMDVIALEGATWLVTSQTVLRVEPTAVKDHLENFEKLDDPLVVQLLSKLHGEHVFTEIVETGSRPPMTITVKDGLTAAIGTEKGCTRTVLLFDPTENASRPLLAHPPQSGPRHFFLLDAGGSCGAPLDGKMQLRGLAADAFVHVSADGEPVAFQLVGYMFGAVFAAPGHTMRDLRPILERSRRAVEHQAE